MERRGHGGRAIRRHVGDLELLGMSTPAEVWVGDRRVATLPGDHPVRVLAGTVVFSVRAPGYVAITRTTEVPAGGLAREHIELVRAPTAEAPLATTARASSPAVLATPTAAAGDGDAPRPATLRYVGVGLAVVGVVLIAVGGGSRRSERAATWSVSPMAGAGVGGVAVGGRF